jgi:hypothetical protein
MRGHCRLVGGLLRRAALDIQVPPYAHRDRAWVDAVAELQRSHRVGKPRLVVGLLGGSIGPRWFRSFPLAWHSALDSRRRSVVQERHWRGRRSTRKSPGVFSPGRSSMSVMAGWVGGRGDSGVPIQLVCIDNVRATIEFPRTPERRCPY